MINCDFRVKSDLPLEIPPHDTVMLEFTLKVDKPGRFEHSTLVYLEDGYLRETTVSIRGEAKERTTAEDAEKR